MPAIDTTKELSELFLLQAQATPNAVALEDDTAAWTYAELDRETAALAQRLRKHGVGRDGLVGVLLGRSADYVISCLAALRAGGAFLVLELAYPPGLLADVVEDARPTVVLTHRAHAGKINADVPLIILDEPETAPITNGVGESNGAVNGLAHPPAESDLERLAFVSYSSGTTGRPKGIANPHMAAVRSYNLRFGLSDLQPGDRVACNVFFIWEILRPLLRGATVVVVPDEASYDLVALVDLLSAKRVTETLMTPTLLASLLSRHSKLGARLPELRTLWLNGEVVTTDLARRALQALPKTRLLNCYSCSETHEVACGDIREMLGGLDESAAVCPVGPLMDPEHAYILDEGGQKVEPGVSGELFVGGDTLAREYLNLPEATAKAFKPNPFDQTPGARLYATGDLARILPSGLLEITGRVGSMIKVRGYSIYPCAVEGAIVKQLAVRHCVVVAHGDGLERQLVAYVVRDEESSSGNRAVLVIDQAGYSPVARKTLSEHLAQYMIPAVWVELDELPTHEVSGKVDLKRLPPPTKSGATTPNGESERDKKITGKMVAEMWASSLNIPPGAVTQERDFFDLGGHSLALADLAGRLTKTFGFPVPLGRLAEKPTLEGHVQVVLDARDGHTALVQADLPSVLRADSALADDLQLPKSGASFRPISEASTVLLTGVTGFLGAFLLNDIMESTSAKIICLVRFNEPSLSDRPAGMARLRKNLVDLGIWNDSVLDRVEILPGNLSQKRLGLSPDAFEELASRVDVIIHAGATVNLVYPYAALRSANVGGTREILRLAFAGGATVHHVSTNGVLPPSTEPWAEDTMVDLDSVPTELLDGYSQTKWVAEELVLEAARRGLPARIYRPGTISGHSASGSTNAWDLLTAILVESMHLGCAPDIEGWLVEMTPVDFVSRAITTLSKHADSSQRIFHLGNPSPVSARSVFDSLAALGYSTERLGWDEWAALWTEKRGSGKWGGDSFTVDILRGGMPTVDFLKSVIVLNDAATKPILSQYGMKRPSIDAGLLETYTRHFYARGWLPKPPTQHKARDSTQQLQKGPLHGKVVVVTGASSGIGAAVASALAQEGASVALAARRTEALEALGNQLKSHGVKVLIHKTDVTDAAQVESLMRTTNDELGPVDILVSCAGVMYFTMMANCHTEEWDRTVDVNCKGLLHCLAHTVPGMLSRGSGHIVAISSDAGRKVFPGLGVYSASKFFVEATLQSLRLETAGKGLRVMSVQPGNTATDLLGMSTDAEAVKQYGEPSGAKIMDPDDVARAIVFALQQPEHVAINEVLIEPRDEPI
ncbi:putative NRPS-like enzyme [Phialemonium atrogriseum]|uniref:NRPS-like enzyme n=1 Tax=Phialemonium atrogriseum TaxID=1093897 RepID=A0AAJ0C2K8_9PEZI|nr:putative NRPS-like enzyme [Phialemonium atrogriseum]KAK1767569.1 putative NRPS-like enzyme [Phialemonium atrogriseum]